MHYHNRSHRIMMLIDLNTLSKMKCFKSARSDILTLRIFGLEQGYICPRINWLGNIFDIWLTTDVQLQYNIKPQLPIFC